MTEFAKSYAIVRDSDGLVETFVKLDVPAEWSPPEGFTAVHDDELPEGWQMIPSPVPPVPVSVTARQIRLWLITHNVSLASVDVAINEITDEMQRDLVRAEWEYAPYVERTHPMLEVLGQALGLDEASIDAAFREAAQI